MLDGDFVEIEYIGKIKDTGEIFDLTDEKLAKEKGIYNEKVKYGPAKIIVGENFVVKGLDKLLKKMKVNEEKVETIKPEDGFGNRDAKLVKVVSEIELKKQKITPFPGMVLDFGDVKARVQSVNSGRVRIDFNHPLAGRELEYKVKINRKIEDKEEKAKVITEFFGGKDLIPKILENKIEIEEKKEFPEKIKKKIAELMKKYLSVEKVDFVRSF